MEEEQKPQTVHAYNTPYGFTIIHEFASGLVKGKQIQHTRTGERTVEFVMNKYPLWKAISFDGDIDFVKNEISKEGFNDIDWQEPGHPIYRGTTYLIEAVKRNRIDIVELLLSHKANPNLSDDIGFTAAHTAIDCQLKDIFELLLKDERLDVNMVNDNADPLLHMLMELGNKEWGEKLVARGADINLHTQDLPCPLNFALGKKPNSECALWLIDLGADITIAFDGITPISFAGVTGAVDTMQKLLDKGAILTLGEYETTPLHTAALNNRMEAVKFVLDKGVDVNIKDRQGRTPVELAARNPEILELLLEKGATIDTSKPAEFLIGAAIGGSLKLMKTFLNTHNMDVLSRDEDGDTPLIVASCHQAKDTENKTAIIELLIEKGSDINATQPGGQGFSALHNVVYNCPSFPENVAALLKGGADPNIQDVDGMTPLHYACQNRASDIIDLLVKAGGDMGIKSHSGLTPADMGKPQVVKIS